MKINGYKFGHPVFGDLDYYDFKPSCNIEVDTVNGNFIIISDEINFGSNTKLVEMIKNDKAKVIAEVFCTHTMFRKVFEQGLKYNISIPLEHLKNKVEVIFMVVANTDMHHYNNPSVKKEFVNTGFYVEKGEVLAYFGEFNFELDLKGTSLDNFIKIRPSSTKTDNKVQYIFIENSIIIELPEKDFAALKLFSENPDYQKLLISSVLQTALIHACYKLSDEQYEENAWSRILKIHWQKNNIDSEFPSTDEVADFVEDLLKKPTHLLLETLSEMDNRDKNTDIE